MGTNRSSATILGVAILLGLTSLGILLGRGAVRVKEYERTVTVKGLAEREYPADIVIWPIQFSAAENNLEALYESIESSTAKIVAFLEEQGIPASAITKSPPSINDKSAQMYGNGVQAQFRYAAVQTVTVYSEDIATVRSVMAGLGQLGKQGIAFTGGDYQARTEYIFSKLNDVKPAMIEEATTNARAVAQKFAEDSESSLGKIKRATQGQFTINDRDQNNPHIKRLRVVSTVEYYLSD